MKSCFYGLVGEKLGHSFSPYIHSLILEKLNLNGNYNLFEIEKENLESAVIGLKFLGCRGANVTIPYKIDIIKYLDNISGEAKSIGAVNTIDFKDGKLTGYNTDYYGFGLMLKKNKVELYNKRAIVLGTGGVSKAVYHYFVDNGIADIVFVSRDLNNIKKDKDINIIEYKELRNINCADVIVNCTPCGMYPKIDESPVDKNIIARFGTAVDLIYNPIETRFLKCAGELGIKGINGLYMLVAQAVVSEEIWNDITIDAEVIDDIYEKFRISRGI
ncbi:shikimate dehydrogenase [Clostridium fermenticellae]|uniref:Shikimate dehydrogenase (NADP(+)) n=1 Tax=Clostridium fermenticellae TaxID=2068654 RepID=A0A386H4G0_9CLOT|nr:shikimate dehydrogenase [Clostridium fermenticellae]AYD40448.1 shikimate dehydrogenase [Clostridium fermenticellae]